MFNHGLYPFVPSLKNVKVLVAVLWILGVLLVLIGLCASEAGAAPAPAGSSSLAAADAFQSPLATPIPTPRATPARLSPVSSVSPTRGAKNVPPDAPLVIEFRDRVDHAAVEKGLTITPRIVGKFTWEDRSVTFTPGSGWEP